MSLGGLVLVLLLAAPKTTAPANSSSKSVRLQTPQQLEAAEQAGWEKVVKDIPAFDAGKRIPPFRWSISNIVREVPVDGVQMVNDVPVRLHSVVVKGRLQTVVEELYDHFLRSGLYMEPIERQDQMFRQVQLTALDTDRAISYTAMVDGLADGTCMIMLGEADIGESTRVGLLRKASSLPEANDFAPLMPLATAPTRVSIEGMRTLSFTVKSSEASVRKFYGEQLKRLGYTEAEVDLYQRKEEEIQLSMSREKEDVNVLLTSRPKLNDSLDHKP